MRIERSGEGLNTLPVASTEIAAHFSMTGASEAVLATVTPYILAATREIEDLAGIALIKQEITLRNVEFPTVSSGAWWDGVREGVPEITQGKRGKLYLPIRPAIEWTEAQDPETGDPITIDGLRILGRDDPELKCHAAPAGAFDLVYNAGFGETPALVPADLRLAVLDHALRLYERRGDETTTPLSLSPVAERIVGRHRRVRL